MKLDVKFLWVFALLLKTLSFIVFAAVFGVANGTEFVAHDKQKLALQNVIVIDSTGSQAQRNKTILPDGDKIKAIHDAKGEIPDGYKVLDLDGHTVIPGLVMLHEHLFYPTGLGNYSDMAYSFYIWLAMYSACLAVADGFSQVMTRLAKNQFALSATLHRRCYNTVIPFICFGGWLIIYQFAGQLKSLVDFATTVAFVSAPIFAWLNMRSMSLPNVPKDMRLKGVFKIYSWVCLTILIGFAVFFIYWLMF